MEKGAAAVMCSDGERGLTFAVVRRMLRCAVVFYRKMCDCPGVGDGDLKWEVCRYANHWGGLGGCGGGED